MKQLDSLPSTAKYVSSKEETLTCEACSKTWTRFSRRGRKPKLCPECITTQQEARAIREPESPEVLEARLVKAREKKAERARERAQQADEQHEQQRQKIAAMLPNLHTLWIRSWEIANRENTDAAWMKCEQLMLNYVNAKKAMMK